MTTQTQVSMSVRQRKVLAALTSEREEFFYHLSAIADEIGMPHRDVRNAARALARKGCARIEHLFDDSTGLTAGSTYVRTREGDRVLNWIRGLA